MAFNARRFCHHIPRFLPALAIIKKQVKMCIKTQKVLIIATLSDFLLSSSKALVPMALHQYVQKFLIPIVTIF